MRATFRIDIARIICATDAAPHDDSHAVPLLPALRRRARARLLKAGEPERLGLHARAASSSTSIRRSRSARSSARRDDRIVLVRRAIEPGYGKWVFPGGYVDRGETADGRGDARSARGVRPRRPARRRWSTSTRTPAGRSSSSSMRRPSWAASSASTTSRSRPGSSPRGYSLDRARISQHPRGAEGLPGRAHATSLRLRQFRNRAARIRSRASSAFVQNPGQNRENRGGILLAPCDYLARAQPARYSFLDSDKMKNQTALVVLCITAVAGAGCTSLERESSLTSPTAAGNNSLLGSWTSSTLIPTPSTCTDFKWNVTEQTATRAQGRSAQPAPDDLKLTGTAQGSFTSAGAISWSAEATPRCLA